MPLLTGEDLVSTGGIYVFCICLLKFKLFIIYSKMNFKRWFEFVQCFNRAMKRIHQEDLLRIKLLRETVGSEWRKKRSLCT